LTRY
jgi:hypothetical protein